MILLQYQKRAYSYDDEKIDKNYFDTAFHGKTPRKSAHLYE